MSGPELTLQGALRHSPPSRRRGGALSVFLIASVAVLLGVWAIAELLAPVSAFVVAAPMALFAVIAAVAARGVRMHYPHPVMGACNLVTLIRAGLISLLAMPLMVPGLLDDSAAGWGFFGVALVAFLMDGIDGWLARRSGLISAFGARFDMEVDAVFAALLALIALTGGQAGWWVLGLGFMRYGFVAAGWALSWLRRDLPDRFRRKAVCVVQIGALIALLAPVVQPPLSVTIAAVALAVLVWSFALDVVWLARRRVRR